MQRVEKLNLKIEKLLEDSIRENSKDPFCIPLILGASDPLSIVPYLSQVQNSHQSLPPQLVLVSTDREAEEFFKSLSFFNPNLFCHTLTSSNEEDFFLNTRPFSSIERFSLEGGAGNSSKKRASKMKWLYRAAQAKRSEIFVLSLKALLRNTLPRDLFLKNVFSFKIGDSLPDDFSSLLDQIGYQSSTFVEDLGTYSERGGLIDLFCPLHSYPLRIELFSHHIQSIRFFDPESQRSISQLKDFTLIPAKEVFFSKKKKCMQTLFPPNDLNSPNELKDLKLVSPLSYFKEKFTFFMVHPSKLMLDSEEFHKKFKNIEENKKTLFHLMFNPWKDLPIAYLNEKNQKQFDPILVSKIEPQDIPDFLKKETQNLKIDPHSKEKETLKENPNQENLKKEQKKNLREVSYFKKIYYSTYEVMPFFKSIKNLSSKEEINQQIQKKIKIWKEENFKIFLSCRTLSKGEIVQNFFEQIGFKPKLNRKESPLWMTDLTEQEQDPSILHLLQGFLSQSLLFKEEKLLFIRVEDLLKHLPFQRKKMTQTEPSFSLKNLSKESKGPILLEDLRRRDLVSHRLYGVGRFEGMKTMNILGFQSEFLVIQYKGKEKLFLPVYRISQIQKWSSSFHSTRILDQLSSDRWIKSKTKIKKKLREIAHELLKLYAKRLQIKRPPFLNDKPVHFNDYLKFESEFPYTETSDQKKAIQEVLKDMTEKETPMDRLICGDVGFGKTEVAMRATFKAVQSGKQVAVIVPTTILCFQHKEVFTKRFKNWPVQVAAINRFVAKKEIQRTLSDLKEKKIDVIIGTHRILSQDVEFKNLGLLIIDEEQKFGVRHKEKIRKLKNNVDTLMISATPIPRTLNFSLSGLKDISLILTPPQGRLSIRTFVYRFEKGLIKKACLNEVKRGGQVLFVHNRIQSLSSKMLELKELLPELRMDLAHGQMKERDLEKIMLSFFEKKTDLLLCTSIIESGIDIPSANTLFVDQAQNFGLSQLYQLRGRIGRSSERAYCYFLLDPHYQNKEVEERLRTLKEFSALGSGIRIAQKDLELRGGGNLLGEEQSGYIHALGYQLYMDLLEEAVQLEKQKEKQKNEPITKELNEENKKAKFKEESFKSEEMEEEDFEPEIRIPIEALIPESYIQSIPLRLAYYRELSRIKNKEDLSLIEEEMLDRFGKLPESLYHLMDISWIQRICRILKVKDLSLTSKKIHLRVLNGTPLASDQALLLFKKESKKYQLRPDYSLLIQLRFKEDAMDREDKKESKKNTGQNKNSSQKREEKISISEVKKELEFLKDLFSYTKET